MHACIEAKTLLLCSHIYTHTHTYIHTLQEDAGVSPSAERKEWDASLAKAFGIKSVGAQSDAFRESPPLYAPDTIKFAMKVSK